MAFNRDRNSRPRFEGRGDRGPVEMHKAICDKCGRECEVPFRPTSGKPVFCSNCFESQRGSEPRRFEDRRPERPEERSMFDAVCDECGNSCKVPFQPSGDKPIYCSSCFGEKKNAGGKDNGQFEALNQKLDRILQLLDTKPQKKVVTEEVEVKPAKKKSSKKTK